MTFYSDAAQTALSLLSEYGQAVTFTREQGRTIDPVTGEVDDEGTTETKTPMGILRRYADSSIDGTRILSSDRELLIDATVFEPTREWSVTIAGENWKVLDVEAIKPADVAIVYLLQVRR